MDLNHNKMAAIKEEPFEWVDVVEEKYVIDDSPSSSSQTQLEWDKVLEEEESLTDGSSSANAHVINKQSQQFICNVYEYIKKNNIGKGPIGETAKAFKLNRQTVSKIIKRGPQSPKRHGHKRRKFEKMDDLTFDLVHREISSYYDKGEIPTAADLLVRLRQICEFPYKETQLRELVKKLGFKFGPSGKKRYAKE
ncbi:hypothetical protein C0J52_02824 [Blattella germanica]|nr:hypothetical protein C0J52_02824 [Blattella germanica]